MNKWLSARTHTYILSLKLQCQLLGAKFAFHGFKFYSFDSLYIKHFAYTYLHFIVIAI